jgi:WD40 repeat protein
METGETTSICRAGSLVNKVAFTPDGKRLLTAQAPAELNLWNADDGSLIRRYEGLAGRTLTAALSPDGKRAYSAGDDGVVLMWDVEQSQPLRKLGEHGRKVKGLAATADRVLTAGEDGIVRVWQVDSGAIDMAETVRRRLVREGPRAPLSMPSPDTTPNRPTDAVQTAESAKDSPGESP